MAVHPDFDMALQLYIAPARFFLSAVPGKLVSEFLTVALAEGEYEIGTAIARPDDRNQMVLRRLRPA
jgi:hypothetical protein